MAFTQPCFIRKNTKELRSYLTHLEYGFMSDPEFYNLGCSDGWVSSFKDCDHDGVDCGTNEELFKAITALNDEIDYMQWFVKDGEWILCYRDYWDDYISDLTVGKKFSSNKQRGEWLDHLGSFHKATVEELIEHFK